MSPRRPAGSPLALAVLTLLAERPMHPYEVGTVIRVRGIEHSVKLNFGSLYSVVDALREAGLIEAQRTVREGKRPERTVYAITATGRQAMHNRLSELLGTAPKEYPRLAAGLSFLQHVPPAEAAQLLHNRAAEVESTIDNYRMVMDGLRGRGLPRASLVEVEYQVALLATDLAWTRRLTDELESGELTYETRGTS